MSMDDLRPSLKHPELLVSSDGEVFLRRERAGVVTLRALNPKPGTKGYRLINVSVDGRRIFAHVHVLVAERVLGPRPTPKHEVRHLNGIRSDNAPGNLAWGTRAENAADRVLHGTERFGEGGPNPKLSASDVAEIQRRAEAGHRQKDIARDFSISQSLVSRLVNGHRWRRARGLSEAVK